MKCKNFKTFAIIGISLIAIMFCGCKSELISLADQGLVSIEAQGTEKVEFISTNVYQQDGQTWASGVLRQRTGNPSVIKTQVDIQVLSKNGSVQHETSSGELYIPRNIAGKGPRIKKMRVQIPNDLSENSRIKMTLRSNSNKSE